MRSLQRQETTAPRAGSICALAVLVLALAACSPSGEDTLDRQAIAKAAGMPATVEGDVIRLGWPRDEVEVTVDGARLPPSAGLSSWAGFKRVPTSEAALVAGDIVVFQDEVDAAIDAALAKGLQVTALHNHFFYDRPRVYYMHIGGRGAPEELARSVRAVREAIEAVRAKNPRPVTGFSGPPPERTGRLDANRIAELTGLKAEEKEGGVVKVSTGRDGRMEGTSIGSAMGLSTWAAFAGNMASASIDGDVAMSASEVRPVLRALRNNGFHIVALHNHMFGETPKLYFVHYWRKGPAAELASGFKAVLDAQSESKKKK